MTHTILSNGSETMAGLHADQIEPLFEECLSQYDIEHEG